jgi:hypothetical protein
LKELEEWFNKNLEKPTSFGRDKLRFGICWFKPMPPNTSPASGRWSKSSNATASGVKQIRTDKPGYVIYEDEWQLVAEPFRKGTMP